MRNLLELNIIFQYNAVYFINTANSWINTYHLVTKILVETEDMSGERERRVESRRR